MTVAVLLCVPVILVTRGPSLKQRIPVLYAGIRARPRMKPMTVLLYALWLGTALWLFGLGLVDRYSR